MPERTLLPKERAGKVSIWLSVLGFASWFVLPVITMLFRTTAPVTDTWVMPFIGVVLMLVAAVSNFITFVFMRQRSVLNVVFFSVTTVFAIFVTVFLVGEGLAGV